MLADYGPGNPPITEETISKLVSWSRKFGNCYGTSWVTDINEVISNITEIQSSQWHTTYIVKQYEQLLFHVWRVTHYHTQCLLRSSSALLDISFFTTHMQDICPVHIHSLTAAWYSHARTSPSSFQPVNQSYVNIRLIYEEPLRFKSIVVHMGANPTKN